MKTFLLLFYFFKSDVLSVNLLEAYDHYYDRNEAFIRIFGLKMLKDMTDPLLRQCQFGYVPGLWNTDILPSLFWFYDAEIFRPHKDMMNNDTIVDEVKREHSSTKNWILSRDKLILINMNWMYIVRMCNEILEPRCSWKYFLNVVDPMNIDYNLMGEINKYISITRDVTPYLNSKGFNKKGYVTPLIINDCYPIKSLEQISAIYIYAVCKQYFRFITHDSLRICPNPCRRIPCSTIPNADIHSCQITGIFENDYVCSCLQGFKWDSKGMACMAENFCSVTCDKIGTDKCDFSPVTGEVECVCRSGYMGYDCSTQENACVSGLNHPRLLTGLEACNSEERNNECHPVLGTSSYSCRCNPPFVQDRNMAFDNCLAQLDPCASLLCVFGSCEISQDGQKSYCQCDLGFKGDQCDEARGEWSPWSNWTQCFPNCGNDSIARRIRHCIGQIDDCIGEPEEIKRCMLDKCSYFRAPEEMAYEIFWKYWMYITLISLCYLLIILILSSTLTLFRSQKTRLQKQEAVKKRRENVRLMFKRLKKKYSKTPTVENIINTLDEVWDTDATDKELTQNLEIIYRILMKLKKKHPNIFEKVAESSAVAALALSQSGENNY